MNESLDRDLGSEIRRRALASGYDLAAFAPPRIEQGDQARLTAFAEACRDTSMRWMFETLPIRLDPKRVSPDVRSVLVLATIYRTSTFDQALGSAPRRIARYAAGRDYHKVLRKKGAGFVKSLQRDFPDLNGRVVVDSAPVAEKALARYSGIGWQGKNTNIIHPELGSYFFLSAILLNIDVSFDAPMTDHCGSCNKCVDTCPTGALAAYAIDPVKCISYWTIEARCPIPELIADHLKTWIFGCDICQEVCPFNRKPSARRVDALPQFHPSPVSLQLVNAEELPDETEWREKATGSALGRAHYPNIAQAWNRSRHFP